MGTYKNSYSVNEDQALWELHEIRHQIHEELLNTPLSKFNQETKDFFEKWKREKMPHLQENIRKVK